MMVLAAATYYQDATYWSPARQGGFGGMTFGAPQAIKVRWEDRTEVFTDLSGNERVSKAIVYTLQPLEVGGFLLLGTSSAADPTSLNNALEISRTDQIPDLRGLNQTNRVFL